MMLKYIKKIKDVTDKNGDFSDGRRATLTSLYYVVKLHRKLNLSPLDLVDPLVLQCTQFIE